MDLAVTKVDFLLCFRREGNKFDGYSLLRKRGAPICLERFPVTKGAVNADSSHDHVFSAPWISRDITWRRWRQNFKCGNPFSCPQGKVNHANKEAE